MSKGQLKKHKDKLKVFLAEKEAAGGGSAATEEKKDGDEIPLDQVDTTGMSAGQLKKHKA